jgi:putative N-acetylmannosamine-6-phosphate epimerase
MPALTEIFQAIKPGGQFLVTDIISPEDAAMAELLSSTKSGFVIYGWTHSASQTWLQ